MQTRLEIWEDKFMLCDDCVQVVANDDYSGIVDARQEKQIRQSLSSMAKQGMHISLGDSEKDETFSMELCDLCFSLAGRRTHCVVLYETWEQQDA
ncbi:MAG: hypothetical protein AABZ39_04885 [Spirochaetota bacterium]